MEHTNLPIMDPIGPELPTEPEETEATVTNVDWSLVAGLLMGKPGNWHRLDRVKKSGARRALEARGIAVEVVGGEVYAAFEPRPMYGPHPDEGEPIGENVAPRQVTHSEEVRSG